MAQSDLEDAIDAKHRHNRGATLNGRNLKLWRLKLRSRLVEFWRCRTPFERRVMKVLAAALLLLAILATMFVRRIADTDPTACLAHRRSPVDGPSHPRARFTVVVNTFRRPERLVKSIRHYGQCPGVDAIRIVWSESPDPPRHLADLSPTVPVRFDVHTRNSINNRFLPLEDLATDAVFNVDDDILVDCASLQFGFDAWRLSPHTLVGYNARIHSRGSDSIGEGEGGAGQGGTCGYGYKQWWHVWWRGEYSIVLTKAAFCHRKYFDMYTNDLPKDVWNYVHEGRNCEDIAMQFLVSNASGLPPIWVKGSYSDSGVIDFKGGVSTGKNHYRKRSDCLTRFAEAFGGLPLVTTKVTVSPFSQWSPYHGPPAFWEWLHPV